MKKSIGRLGMAMLMGALILSGSANVLARNSGNEFGAIGGYVVVKPTPHNSIAPFTSVTIQVTGGTLQGTWTHGNTGIVNQNLFSQVIGNSGAGFLLTEGLGTAINGNGEVGSGGWQGPGFASRGQVNRTIRGINRALWNLRMVQN